jgi:predicted phosphate transport protein (TIGR00153 family)
VAFKFRPVDGVFYDLFVESANHLVTGATLLAEMFNEESDRDDVVTRMREAERAADETVRAIVTRVNSTFVTPFDREDIHSLANLLDDVMDLIDEAVDMIHIYEVHEIPTEITKQASVIQRCADLTAAAMPQLRSMKGLEDYIAEVNRLERTGDKNYRRILAKPFSGDYKAMQVLKLKDIVECLEAAIDGMEKVANTVEQIAVKES